MIQRILVAIKDLEAEQEVCDAAIQLAKENNARLLWVHALDENASINHKPMQLFHNQVMTNWGIESDIVELEGELNSVIQEQIKTWCPELMLISQKYKQDLRPPVANLETYLPAQEQQNNSWIVLKVPSFLCNAQ